jgi:hypothetical protein
MKHKLSSNHISSLDTGQTKELIKEVSTGFGNWLNDNDYIPYKDGTWFNRNDSGEITYLIEELYNSYLETL